MREPLRFISQLKGEVKEYMYMSNQEHWDNLEISAKLVNNLWVIIAASPSNALIYISKARTISITIRFLGFTTELKELKDNGMHKLKESENLADLTRENIQQ